MIHVPQDTRAAESGLVRIGAKGASLPSVQVLLLGMPAMLRQILRSMVTEASDAAVVGELPHHGLRSREVLERRPDLVIVAAEEATHEDVAVLLQRCRTPRVLAVSSDGTSGVLYEMTPQRTTIEELSREAVARAVLTTVSGTRWPGRADGV
jgi:chemotaxis response regulator CheB